MAGVDGYATVFENAIRSATDVTTELAGRNNASSVAAVLETGWFCAIAQCEPMLLQAEKRRAAVESGYAERLSALAIQVEQAIHSLSGERERIREERNTIAAARKWANSARLPMRSAKVFE